MAAEDGILAGMGFLTATHLVRPSIEPVVRLLTVADLAAMPDELPSGTVKYELDNGRLIIVGPNDIAHGSCHARLGTDLYEHCEKDRLGMVLMSVGVILWSNPDRCVGPDISFVSERRLPIKTSPEDYLETIPDLVVEVRSRHDTTAYLDRKVADYLRASVQLVWIVEPEAQIVTEYRPGLSAKALGTSDTLQCDDVIQGFRLPLAELFKE